LVLILELGGVLQVKDLEEPHLTEAVSVGFPTIVKTMMACGTSDAHTMVFCPWRSIYSIVKKFISDLFTLYLQYMDHDPNEA